MRFITTIAAGLFATVASAQDVTKPFYLTFETDSGDEYPATVGGASRGVEILSAWTEYRTQFVLDADTMRFAGAEPSTLGNGNLDSPNGPVIFSDEDLDEEAAAVESVEGSDGKVYLVKKGANDTMGWWSEPVTGDNFNNVYWKGNDEANSRLRIDNEKPTGGK